MPRRSEDPLAGEANWTIGLTPRLSARMKADLQTALRPIAALFPAGRKAGDPPAVIIAKDL